MIKIKNTDRQLSNKIILIISVALSVMIYSKLQAAEVQLPDHDIVLFKLIKTKSGLEVTQPQVIAVSNDYENQPAFSLDGQSIFYTRIQSNNADLWQYQMTSGQARQLSHTGTSEYSPTPIPFIDNSLSTVRVEPDNKQRLWQFNSDQSLQMIFETIEPVGYHRWVGKNIALFVLGEPHQLVVAKYGDESTSVVDQNIGRCLQAVPETNSVSYTQVVDGRHQIKTYDFTNKKVEANVFLPGNTQDFVWLSNNQMISSNGSQLMTLSLKSKSGWQPIKNSTNFKLAQITRLAISPSGEYLAVVHVKP